MSQLHYTRFKKDVPVLVVPLTDELYTLMYEESDKSKTYEDFRAAQMKKYGTGICAEDTKVSFKMYDYGFYTNEKMETVGGTKEFKYTVSGAAQLSDGRAYSTFEEAYANAEKDDTITLLKDITLDNSFELKYNINLNKHSLILKGKNSNTIFNGITVSEGNIVIPDGWENSETILKVGFYDDFNHSAADVTFKNVNIEVGSVKEDTNLKGNGVIGIFNGGKFTMDGGSISTTGEMGNAIFNGNGGVGMGNLVLKNNVKITTDAAGTEKLMYYLNVDVDGLNFNGALNTWAFTTVNGTVKNSKFTYTNAETKGFLRDPETINLTLINNTIEDIPAFKTAGLSISNADTKVYMDDVTASYFENLEKVTPLEGYYYDKADGKIKKSQSKVVDTASSSGVSVTLDDLRLNGDLDNTKDTTYQVVVSTVKEDDKAAVNEVANNNTDKDVIAYDIKVVDTENGEKVNVTNQDVTITLPTALPEGTQASDIKVIHIKDDGIQETLTVTKISDDRKSITFTATSFSAIAIVLPKTVVATTDVTNNVTVDFEPIAGTNEYNIVLKADSGKVINGLLTADLTFELTQGTGVVAYDIKPAAEINLIKKDGGRFEFNFDGTSRPSLTADSVTIGKVVFDGYCKNASFAVKTAATNVVHTTKTTANVVEDYTVGGAMNLNVANTISNIEIKEATKELTITIDFPNAINDQVAAYQDMKVGIVSANSNEEIALGSDEVALNADGQYVITKELIKDRTYTVTVSGAGYRTANHTVTMSTDKSLKFWNDAKKDGSEISVEDGTTAKKTTFLAGELVKDGKINIYDLSAVVSYFGVDNTVSAASPYAKYDLNRDGKIDSKDISMVLVSWGN